MKLIIIVIFLLLINPIYTNDTNISDLELLLEYYNPETLLYKPSIEIIITRSDGKRLEKPINERLAKQVLKADYNFYNRIFPGEIIFEKEKLIGITYIIPCGAGGFCEYEKLAIISYDGELINDHVFSKHLGHLSGKLIKENVFISDSLMIFKTSHIKRNPKSDSITSINIELETINISDDGKITIADNREIDTKRKFYWISTDVVPDSTLEKYSKPELAEMRNEILAAYGYSFKVEKWRNNFENKDWYKAQCENVNDSLKIIERMNIQKILHYEKLESQWQKYKNQNMNFEIHYPVNWFLKVDSLSMQNYNYLDRISIENMKEKVIVAGGGPFTEHGSFLNISVIAEPHEWTIEDAIRNGDLPERVKKQRLDQIIEMEIGGIYTFVWKGGSGSAYEFIYEGKRFRIFFMSGCKEQFEKDLQFFEKMLESFKIIK